MQLRPEFRAVVIHQHEIKIARAQTPVAEIAVLREMNPKYADIAMEKWSAAADHFVEEDKEDRAAARFMQKLGAVTSTLFYLGGLGSFTYLGVHGSFWALMPLFLSLGLLVTRRWPKHKVVKALMGPLRKSENE